MEYAGCVKLPAKVEVLEKETTELMARVEVLESTNINFKEQLNSLTANLKNLMDHVVPTNEIRLRVLLFQFRDYLGKHLGAKPTNQTWSVYLENIANDPAQLLISGVSKEAVLFLSTEFGMLCEYAHVAPADLVSQAIDAVQIPYKRDVYREIFNKVHDCGFN
jgi:hypothetical protein